MYKHFRNLKILVDYVQVNQNICVKNLAGDKAYEQKCIILLYLKETFKIFKTSYPEDPKIKFCAFSSLRPQYCVLAGASGTYSVCVCTYHQNPKL